MDALAAMLSIGQKITVVSSSCSFLVFSRESGGSTSRGREPSLSYTSRLDSLRCLSRLRLAKNRVREMQTGSHRLRQLTRQARSADIAPAGVVRPRSTGRSRTKPRRGDTVSGDAPLRREGQGNGRCDGSNQATVVNAERAASQSSNSGCVGVI